MSTSIKCRKCGGNHLTIKCNKNAPEQQEITNDKKKHNDVKPSHHNNDKPQHNNDKPQHNNDRPQRYNNNGQQHHNNDGQQRYNNDGQQHHNNDGQQRYNNDRPQRYNNDGHQRYNNRPSHYNNDGQQRYNNDRPSGKVKMCSLPSDITKEELQELLYDWGHVKYINIKNYQDDTVAYIEFKDEVQADYLIEALDGTPFEFRVLKLSRIE